MTKEEARELIKWHYDYEKEKIDTLDETIPEFEIAIECIEKQIPKKPINSYIQTNIATRIRVSVCPVCKSHLIITAIEQQKYCDNCGQSIEWSEEDDKN